VPCFVSLDLFGRSVTLRKVELEFDLREFTLRRQAVLAVEQLAVIRDGYARFFDGSL
jgi:hypothetical protein